MLFGVAALALQQDKPAFVGPVFCFPVHFFTMKKQLLPVLLLLNATLFAQILAPSRPALISSAGETAVVTVNDVRVCFAVGETVVVTFLKPSLDINLGQGFHSLCDTIAVDLDEPDFAARQLKIYPNPASDFLFVEFEMAPPSPGFLTASLIDLTGREVLPPRQLDGFFENRLPLNGLPAGPYLLRLTDESGRVVGVPIICGR